MSLGWGRRGAIAIAAPGAVAIAILGAAESPGADLAAPAAEPAECLAAYAAHPTLDPIAALRAEERERWRIARKAGRAGRRAMRGSLGMGPGGGSQARVGDFQRASDAHRVAMRQAAVLCQCRSARRDPDGARCDRLYPGGSAAPATPPSLPRPLPPHSLESQSSPREAANIESGS